MVQGISNSNKTYDNLVDLTEDYLGPAAERFIQRQIRVHLDKEPDQLTQNDLPKLANWVKVAIAILTEDSQMVNQYTNGIIELSKKKE